MAWNTTTLQTEILEQFADPRWHEHIFSQLQLAKNLSVVSDQTDWNIATRHADRNFELRVAEFASMRYMCTTAEMAKLMGCATHSGLVACGHALAKLGWTHKRGPAGTSRNRWINEAAVLQRLAGSRNLDLNTVSAELGMSCGAIATVLLDAGWTRVRTGGGYRRWNPPASVAKAA